MADTGSQIQCYETIFLNAPIPPPPPPLETADPLQQTPAAQLLEDAEFQMALKQVPEQQRKEFMYVSFSRLSLSIYLSIDLFLPLYLALVPLISRAGIRSAVAR